MPWDNQNGNGNNPWGSGGSQVPPDVEAWIKNMQKKMRQMSSFGGKSGVVFIFVVIAIIWGLSGFYRVQADEQGVVLRFGKLFAQTRPGLNYHIPWPIESVLTPKVTIVNRIDIGMRGGSENLRNYSINSYNTNLAKNVPEESLMLTGDENIIDINFSVFWVINDAADFLFNIQNPEGAIKDVAESTMREIVGQNNIQPILTEQRQRTEEDVRHLMQKILNTYGSGVTVTQVKMQKVDPPVAVIDSFRDVQAAKADQERARNEAQAYANRIVPEAQGEAVRITRESEAYREQTVAEAEGQASRFAAVYNEYRMASDVTRQRIFLETVEKVMQKANKVIIDPSATKNGVIPYLPLNQLNNGRTK